MELYDFESFLHNLIALNIFEIFQQSFYSNFSKKSLKNQRNQLNSEIMNNAFPPDDNQVKYICSCFSLKRFKMIYVHEDDCQMYHNTHELSLAFVLLSISLKF